MAATWAGYHFIPSTFCVARRILLPCSTCCLFLRLLRISALGASPLPASLSLSLSLSLALCLSLSLSLSLPPPFLSSSFSVLYLFILLGRRPRSLSLGAPAGWLLTRRWTLLLRILLLSKQQRSTTSSPGESAYSDLPQLGGREKERKREYLPGR